MVGHVSSRRENSHCEVERCTYQMMSDQFIMNKTVSVYSALSIFCYIFLRKATFQDNVTLFQKSFDKE